MKHKWFKMVLVNTVLFHTDEFIFVRSFKNGNGRQSRSSGAKGPKLNNFGGRVPKLSSRVTSSQRQGRRLSYKYV